MININQYNKALFIALLNSVSFFILSVALYISKPEFLTNILFVPFLFFVGSMYSFWLMVRRGGMIIPISWFVLGTGIFFGLGVIAGGLKVHRWTGKLFGEDLQYLVNVNLLNSSSVMIVIVIVYILFNYNSNNNNFISNNYKQNELRSNLIKLSTYIYLLAIIGIMLKLFHFPLAEDLITRSIIDKLNIFVSSGILLFGFLYKRTKIINQLLGFTVICLSLYIGLMSFSKYDVVITLLAFIAGVLIRSHSIKSVITGFSSIVIVYILLTPMVTYGRGHIDYNPSNNSISDRASIVKDVYNSFRKNKVMEVQPSIDVIYYNGIDSNFLTETEVLESVKNKTIKVVKSKDFKNMREEITIKKQARSIGMRFDVATIQGYLVDEYNAGRPGESLNGFWSILIPRVFWPDKPIMTGYGTKLNRQYYKIESALESGSSIAPTYSGEAYWNYGYKGVILVSTCIGLIIAWLSSLAYRFLNNIEPAYLFIAMPMLVTFAHVESWIVSTYIGGVAILVLVLLAFRLIFYIYNLVRRNNYLRIE